MRKNIVVLFVVTLFTVLVACSNSSGKEDATTAVQQVAGDSNAAAAMPLAEERSSLPAFRIKDVNGNVVDLQSFKGKKVFVNLWATWCPPCRIEIPSIEKLNATANKEKVTFIMLSLDENFELAKKFAKREKMKVPVYYPAENLPALFNTDYIPATFIFDEEGKLIRRVDGMDDYNTAAYISLLR